jgi:uncharacterized protein YkwD
MWELGGRAIGTVLSFQPQEKIFLSTACRTPLTFARHVLLTLLYAFEESVLRPAVSRNSHASTTFQAADDVVAAHNLIRAGLGRPPIIWDGSLAEVARNKVKCIYKRQFIQSITLL